MASEPKGAGGATRRRVSLAIFLVPVLVLLARSAFVNLWQRYVYLPNALQVGTTSGLSTAYQFGSTLGAVVIFPLALFGILYLLGRNMDPYSDWRAIAVSAFLGGAVGDISGLVPALAAFYGADFSAYLRSFATDFGNGWVLGNLILYAISDGAICAFAALAAPLVARGMRKPGQGIDGASVSPGLGTEGAAGSGAQLSLFPASSEAGPGTCS